MGALGGCARGPCVTGWRGEKARAAIVAGAPLDQAADAYQLPAGLGEWVMFSPTYFRVAFQAWAKELGAR